MEDYIVRLVVCGVISWTTLFISVRKMFPNISFSFCNRIVSKIHASLCVILASLSVQDWNCPVCPMASSSSPFQDPDPLTALMKTPSRITRRLIKQLWFHSKLIFH
ncbi:hypothetical protein MKX01_001491, partial [Papaver californicum]